MEKYKMVITYISICLAAFALNAEPIAYFGKTSAWSDAKYEIYETLYSIDAEDDITQSKVFKDYIDLRDDILILYSQLLVSRDKFNRAKEILDNLDEKYSDTRFTIYNMGRGRTTSNPFRTPDRVAATKRFYTFIDQYPDYSLDMVTLINAKLLIKIGKLEFAVRELSRYLAKYRNGRFVRVDREQETLIRRFNLIRVEEKIRFLLCEVLIHTKRYKEAIAILKNSSTIYSHSVSYLLFLEMLALCYQEIKDEYNEKIILQKLISVYKKRKCNPARYIHGKFTKNHGKKYKNDLTKVEIIMRPFPILEKRLADLK